MDRSSRSPYLNIDPYVVMHKLIREKSASLPSTFAPQGLLCPGQIHLYLALLLHRDYFAPARFISILLFSSTGIISTARMHLYLPLFFHRDDFHRPDASLSCSFVPQGLFCPSRMHLYLPLLLHRDDFRRPDASLSSSFAPQGLLCPDQMRPNFRKNPESMFFKLTIFKTSHRALSLCGLFHL